MPNIIPLEYYDLVEDYDDYGRFYYTPSGARYPSVTTVLGKIPKPALDEWKKRVGEDEACRIMNRSADIGNDLHQMCESYLLNETVVAQKSTTKSIFNSIKKNLAKIDNVRGVELPLWSDKLKLAGRTDCIAEYNGELSIIDFKNSRKPKERNWISNYFMQGAFYSKMVYDVYKLIVPKIVVIIAVWGSKPQIFEESVSDWIDPAIEVNRKYNPLLVR